jgi:hypothetical protein
VKLREIDQPSFILDNELHPASRLLTTLKGHVAGKSKLDDQTIDNMLHIQRIYIQDIDGRIADINEISPLTATCRKSLSLHAQVRQIRSDIVDALISLKKAGNMAHGIIADCIEAEAE